MRQVDQPERDDSADRGPALTGKGDPTELRRLLDEWMLDDEAEQRETFEFLMHALDEDRPLGYKLFS